MKLGMLVPLLALASSCVAPAPVREPAAVSLHGYYLFRFDADGVNEYVPLLVTSEPLEALAAAGDGTTPVVLITTYARDSIWTLERDVPLSTAQLSPATRSLRVRDEQYLYQEITAAEVLRLLDRPGGTMSVHRSLAQAVPRREELQDLIAGFGGAGTP